MPPYQDVLYTIKPSQATERPILMRRPWGPDPSAIAAANFAPSDY